MVQFIMAGCFSRRLAWKMGHLKFSIGDYERILEDSWGYFCILLMLWSRRNGMYLLVC